MTLEEKLLDTAFYIHPDDHDIIYTRRSSLLSICQEAVVEELQGFYNKLPLMSDLTTVSERIYARIKELKEKL